MYWNSQLFIVILQTLQMQRLGKTNRMIQMKFTFHEIFYFYCLLFFKMSIHLNSLQWNNSKLYVVHEMLTKFIQSYFSAVFMVKLLCEIGSNPNVHHMKLDHQHFIKYEIILELKNANYHRKFNHPSLSSVYSLMFGLPL